jgi:hypothetical protein
VILSTNRIITKALCLVVDNRLSVEGTSTLSDNSRKVVIVKRYSAYLKAHSVYSHSEVSMLRLGSMSFLFASNFPISFHLHFNLLMNKEKTIK